MTVCRSSLGLYIQCMKSVCRPSSGAMRSFSIFRSSFSTILSLCSTELTSAVSLPLGLHCYFYACVLLYVWCVQLWAGIAQSVQRLVTDWTVRVSNLGGGEILRTRPERPWGPPSLLYNGYRVFPGGKAAGAWR